MDFNHENIYSPTGYNFEEGFCYGGGGSIIIYCIAPPNIKRERIYCEKGYYDHKLRREYC